MKNLFNLFAITMLFFVTSCQKEEILKEEIPVPVGENPYNSFGEDHNIMLADFFTTYGQELGAIQSPIEKESFITQRMMEDNNESPDRFYQAKEALGLNSTQVLADYDFTNVTQLTEHLRIGGPALPDYEKLLEDLLKILGTTSQGQTDIQNKVRAFEIMMIKNHKEDAEFVKIMTIVATLKSSSSYWFENNEVQEIAGAKWWQIVLADAAGAGIGLLSGGTTSVPLAAGFSAAVTLAD